MEIIFDTLGSERGVEPVVRAALRLQRDTAVSVAFLGSEKNILPILKNGNSPDSKIRILETDSVIAMDEFAPDACNYKSNASVNIGMLELKSGRSQAFVSPGHTGATVYSAREILGLLPRVKRPGLCQLLPTTKGYDCVMLDVGASLAAESEDQLIFGEMGRRFCMSLLNRPSPRSGLLNIGAEPTKGNLSLVESHAMLTRFLPGFHGNLEGHEIWTGTVDVIITDGITGNIVLKAAEGLLHQILKHFSQTNLDRRDSVPTFPFQISRYGGALLLGVSGVCVVTHGQAGEDQLYNAGIHAWNCCNAGIVTDIAHHLQNVAYDTGSS